MNYEEKWNKLEKDVIESWNDNENGCNPIFRSGYNLALIRVQYLMGLLTQDEYNRYMGITE